MGLWEGSTENATVATALLSDLVERRLDPAQGILFVIDGSKALRKAIRRCSGRRLYSAVSGTRNGTAWRGLCSRIIGYRDLARLAVAIEHDLGRTTAPPRSRRPLIVISA